MFDINGNASQPLSAIVRQEHAALWRAKSSFWAPFAIAGNAIGLVLCVISISIPGTQVGLTGAGWAFIVPGFAAMLRQTYCARRARRITAGAR